MFYVTGNLLIQKFELCIWMFFLRSWLENIFLYDRAYEYSNGLIGPHLHKPNIFPVFISCWDIGLSQVFVIFGYQKISFREAENKSLV